VPDDSTILNSITNPLLTNKEHLYKSVESPGDKCVEQKNSNPPSLNGLSAVSDHPEAVTLDLGEHTADEPLPYFYSANH
jgi:hypothetical protein